MADDDRFIWFEVDEDETMLGFKLQEERTTLRIKSFLEELGDHGIELLSMYANEETGYTDRHIDKSNVSWSPGGPGGGGSHELIVGVKAGTSYHPVYANIGTGIYGRFKTHIVSPSGGLMIFYGSHAGRVLARRKIKGQRPQQYLYKTWRDLAIYSEARLLSMAFFGTPF